MEEARLRYVLFLREHARTDVHAIMRDDGKYYPISEKPAQYIVERHLNSSPPIGLYLVKGEKTQAAVIDLDSHDGLLSWPDMVDAALKIIAAAVLLGLRAHTFRSGGGRGIHLWFLWEKPQNARHVRHLLRNMLASVGLRDGTGGVAKGEVEIFPKQDRVGPGKFGNLIALPGARASALLDAQTLEPMEWETVVIHDVMMRFSDPVPEVAEEEKEVAAFVRLEGDEELVRTALRHLPADNYLTWVRVSLALKDTFGEGARAIFDEWSATCPAKYSGSEQTGKFWDGLKPNGEIGIGSIFYMARQHGWNGPTDPMVREMNAQYGVYTHGRTTEIIIKNAHGGPEEIFIGKQPFFDRLAGEVIERRSPDGDVERIQKARAWIIHRRASHYTRVAFDPALPPGHNGDTWNLWKGFAVEPAPGDWSLLKDHILENISQGSADINCWLLNWMALGVQQPGLVIGTAPVLIGFPGTGKGVLAHAYGRLWGAHFIPVTHAEHVTGRFSGHLFARRFIFIDEGIFGGNRRDAGVIKTRITDPVIVLERKGVDAITVPNNMIFMIASNEASVVPADKGDRRWMVIEVGDGRREDSAYFAAIQAQMDSGGYAAMLHELLMRDVKVGSDPRKTIKTEALFEQTLLAQPAEVRYLHGLLEEGRLPQNWIAGPSSTTIRAMLEHLHDLHRDARRMDLARLGRFINKVIPQVRTGQGGTYFVKKVESGFLQERSTQYDFPSLAQARRAFSKYMNMPIAWAAVNEWQSDPDPREEHGDDDVIG